jgi:homoserine O-acetyltransferase
MTTVGPPAVPADRALQVQHVPSFRLDCGVELLDVRQAYFLDGRLNAARDNLVLVFHALTGSPDAAGDWWRGMIGPGRAIDTDRYAVLCPNLLGSCYGTTGPATAWRAAGASDAEVFPAVTPRDMARLAALLVDALDVREVALVTGGSLGGMVALEWALLHPGRARSTVVLAAPSAHTALAIGWNHVQREAVRLAAAAGRPADGLALARMVGMLSFRTEVELDARFGRRAGTAAPYAVQDYLTRHGEKLVARFDPASYLTLLDAMDAHDVGAGRGGTEAALRALREREAGPGDVVAVGIPGDLLYGAEVVRAWAEAAGATYRELHSAHGHDAFLLETEQVGCILADALAPGGRARTVRSGEGAAPGAPGRTARSAPAPAAPTCARTALGVC